MNSNEITKIVGLAQQYVEEHHRMFIREAGLQESTVSWLLDAFNGVGNDFAHPEKLIEQYPHLAYMVIRLGSAYNILRIYNRLLEEQKKVSSAN